MPKIIPALALLCILTGCAEFPELDASPPSSGAAPPVLVPLDSLLDQTAASALAPDLAPRAARLKARAALMRGPVMDPATRARLASAITSGGG
jgi:hypothetical protein